MVCQIEQHLQHWLIKIEQGYPKEIELTLDRITCVAERGGLLSLPCPVVMVAGTNGKGSTVATLAKLIMAAGLKVATYTSPHLLQFNERIQINGKCVEDEQLCRAFAHIEYLKEDTFLTFFEYTTLSAFTIFQQWEEGLDLIILEVGLGGRLDAVNIIAPDVAIITSIGIDHQEFLGNTREKIAKEKAGIFRSHIPVILSKDAALDSLLQETAKMQNTVYIEGQDFKYYGRNWCFDQRMVELPDFSLPKSSVSLALAAYTILKRSFLALPEISLITNCIEKVAMLGRFQCMKLGEVNVIFDVAHNPDASLWLASRLKRVKGQQKLHAVWASLDGKDLPGIIAPMKNMIEKWFCGELLGIKRANLASKLSDTLKAQGIQTVFIYSTIFQAFKEALKSAQPGSYLVVFGSFYTVAEVLKNLSFSNKSFENNGLFYQELPTWKS